MSPSTTAKRPSSDGPPEPAAGYRNSGPLSLLLGLTMAVGPLAHYMLSAVGPTVITELRLSRTQFGAFWGVTFAVATVLTLPAGRLTDRFGSRRAMLGVLTSGVIALAVLGVAPSFWVLVGGLVFAGVAQSASNAATNKAVAAHVAPSQRGFVVGVKQSGVQVGQLVVGLLAPAVSIWVGWRSGFFALVLIGLVGLVFALRLPGRETTQPPGPSTARRPPRMSRELLALVAYAVPAGAVIQATNVYMPLFAFESHDVPADLAGIVTAALGGVGVAARLAWGRLLDRVHSLPRLRSSLAVATALSLVVVWLSSTVGPGLMWVGIGLFSSTAMAATVVLMLEVVREIPDHIGYASSYVSLGLMGGFMLGPVLFGFIVDQSSGYGPAWLTLIALSVGQLVVNLVLQRPSTVRI